VCMFIMGVRQMCAVRHVFEVFYSDLQRSRTTYVISEALIVWCTVFKLCIHIHICNRELCEQINNSSVRDIRKWERRLTPYIHLYISHSYDVPVPDVIFPWERCSIMNICLYLEHVEAQLFIFTNQVFVRICFIWISFLAWSMQGDW
jgi:hypothetical protein